MGRKSRILNLGFVALLIISMASCGIYSLSGIDTSGAESFSVDFFRMQTPLASQDFSNQLTEQLRDQLLQQSPLSLVNEEGDLQYSGAITGYQVSAAAVQSNETASYSRLSVTIKVSYVNTIDKDKSFDRSFTEYADFESSQDLFSVEAQLWEEIIEKLVQSVYNESLGNW